MTYTYNSEDKLTKAVTTGTNGEISNKTYTYDAKGNELTETDSITNTSLIYENDTESRLLRATLKNGSTVVATQENWYNGNGQRIGKTEAAAKNTASPVTDTMRYFYDGTTVLYTMDDAGNLTTKNFVGTADNAIATRRYEGSYADKNYFYLKDIRGTVTSIVDESMNGVASYEYDEFGITTVNGDEDFENQICYTGGIYDELTGLYYLNARYYDPETGRFLSEDTYRGETNDFATWHLYVYCANNPVNYTDPSGHWFFSVGVDFSASIIFTYRNTTQITLDTKGYFTVENSRCYGVKFAWPNVSTAGFFMCGSGYVEGKKSKRSFDIGADVQIGGFSFSAGMNISKDSASAYASLGYTPKKYSWAKGYLQILKAKEISPHAYLVCSNGIGKYSIANFLKKKINYKKTKYIGGRKVVMQNKKKYIKVSFKNKNFKVSKNKVVLM